MPAVKLLPKGHVSCLSKAFKYTSSGATDIAATFRRVRKAMARSEQERLEKVRPFERHKEVGR